MNNTLVYTIRLLIIACVAFFLGGCLRKKPKENESILKDIINFSFNYSVGYAMNCQCSYKIDYIDNKFIASYKKNGIPEEDRLKKEISSEKIKELENLLNNYKVYKWDGFNKSDKNVLDGDDFSLSITTLDKRHIRASGYESYPDNYGEVNKEIQNFFFEIFKEEK